METDNLDDNLEELKEVMYRKGFGTDHTEELVEKLNSGKREFVIEHDEKVKDDLAAYNINFARGGDENKGYLNSFDLSYYEKGDTEKEPLVQNFPAKFLITKDEAFRMLKHGTHVAVNKTLFNKKHEKYNTWISIDTSAPKDKYGNFPLNTYHQNYYGSEPFDVKEAIMQVRTPLKDLEFPLQLENAETKLKKGHILEVTMFYNDREQTGFLTVAPGQAGVILYDRHPDLQDAVAIENIARPRQRKNTTLNSKQEIKEPDSEQKKKASKE